MSPPIDRQRDLFPLPHIDCPKIRNKSLSRSVARRHLRDRWPRTLANEAIDSLNFLANRGSISSDRVSKASVAAGESIYETIRQVEAPGPDAPSPQGALQALLGSSQCYEGSRCDIAPFDHAATAWPPEGTTPVCLQKVLPPGEQPLISDWERILLRDPADAASIRAALPFTRPHCDPKLFSSRLSYGRFLRRLHASGMLRFRLSTPGEEGSLGVFFVYKKDGTHRIIFDTRLLNPDFVDPPSTQLPSGAAFAGLEIDSDSHLYVASGDISNAFYYLGIPNDLSDRFSLPPPPPLGPSIWGCRRSM